MTKKEWLYYENLQNRCEYAMKKADYYAEKAEKWKRIYINSNNKTIKKISKYFNSICCRKGMKDLTSLCVESAKAFNELSKII